MSDIEQATLREWMLENVSEELETIAEQGCANGFIVGLVCYDETSAIYDAYQEEIWTLLAEQAEAFGFDSALAFIASFKAAKKISDQATFKNLLTWYAVEELARQIIEEKEDESL